MVRIQLVNIKPRRFPVLMQAKGHVEPWLFLQPRNVGADFLGFGVQVLAVQIEALRILPAVERKTGGIEARTEPDVRVGRPAIFLEHLEDGQRAGWFITVDARGNVNALVRLGHFAGESEQPIGIGFKKSLGPPSVIISGLDHFANHTFDVDAFTKIFSVIFSQSLHGWNLAQKVDAAKG